MGQIFMAVELPRDNRAGWIMMNPAGPANDRLRPGGEDGLQFTYDRFIAGDPEQESLYEQALFDAEVASMIYELRTKAGLSQRALAKKVGTTASVICRLEDADYEGHSLAMLRRIAAALGKRVELRFVPAVKPKRSRARQVA